MPFLTWVTDKFRPPAADEPQNSSGVEVVASSGEAVDSKTALGLEIDPSLLVSSSASLSVPVQNKLPRDDETKATVSFAPSTSDFQSSSATTITNRRGASRVPNMDLALAGESSRSSPSAKESDLRPLTPYPPTTTTKPVRGGPVSRDEFNEYREEMEGLLQEANAQTKEAYRQMRVKEQRHEREKLDWQQKLDSVNKELSSRPLTWVRQQKSPSEQRESSVLDDTRSDKNSGASLASTHTSSVSTSTSIPFKLRKLSTELVLARAEASMILREWDEMEKRGQEALTMASDLCYEPLIARCQFFLGIAFYGQERWALARDALEFAKPSVGIYITRRELNAWKQKVETVMGLSPVRSIGSMSTTSSRAQARQRSSKTREDLGSVSSPDITPSIPSVHSAKRTSKRGWENASDFWSGDSTVKSTPHPIFSPKDLPTPNERSPRPRKIKVLPRPSRTTSISTQRDGSPSPSVLATTAAPQGDFPLASEYNRSVHRSPSLPPEQQPESPLDAHGSKMAVVYSGGDASPKPMTNGAPLTLAIPDVSVAVPPRRPRLYTPGDDYVHPWNPFRQGPQLKLTIPISPVRLRPSRIYMPEKPGVVLYPQKPFRQGERVKVTIPSPEPQSAPEEVSFSPENFVLLGYPIKRPRPTQNARLPPPTPSPFSDSSGGGSAPKKPAKSPPRGRTQGLQIRNPGLPTSDAPSKSSKSDASLSSNSFDVAPEHRGPRIVDPNLPKPDTPSTTSSQGAFPRFRHLPMIGSSGSESEEYWHESRKHINRLNLWPIRDTSSVFEGSPDELSRFIEELSQPIHTQLSRVVNPTSSAPNSGLEEPSRLADNPAVPDRPRLRLLTSNQPGLRVVNRNSFTTESSPDNPPPAPNRTRLRVMNPDPKSESSPDNPPPTPDRPRLRPPTPSGPHLRVMNPDPTPESSHNKPRPALARPRLRVVNRNSSTAESSPDNPPPAPDRPRLRVMNPDPTSESSPDNPPPAPDRPRLRPPTPSGPHLRVMNPDPTPESSHDKLSRLPNRPRLRVVNRTSSTAESSPDNAPPAPDRPRLRPPTPNGPRLRVMNPDPTSESSLGNPPPTPDLPRLRPPTPDGPHLRVMNPDPTPESSHDKPPRIPNRPRLRVVNRTSSTPDSGHSDPSWRHAQAGDTRFTSEGRSKSTGEATWFPDTGSGIPRYLESPDRYPDGLFKEDVIQSMIENLRNPTEAEYEDTETEVTLEIDSSILQGGSTRPDIRDMVWRPPSRDSMQAQRRDEEEMSGSSDEPDNMAFVRLLGLGITTPTNTLHRGSRVSRRSNSEPPEDDQMLDDYIEETDDEGRVRHSGIRRIRRGRSGDLGSSNIGTSEDENLWNDYLEDSDDEGRVIRSGTDRIRRSRSGNLESSGNDWRREYAIANASTGTLSGDDSLLVDARKRHEGYTGEEEQEDEDEKARLGSGGDGSDRVGRSRSRENPENRSRRSDGNRSRSENDGGESRIGENDLGLTF